MTLFLPDTRQIFGEKMLTKPRQATIVSTEERWSRDPGNSLRERFTLLAWMSDGSLRVRCDEIAYTASERDAALEAAFRNDTTLFSQLACRRGACVERVRGIMQRECSMVDARS